MSTVTLVTEKYSQSNVADCNLWVKDPSGNDTTPFDRSSLLSIGNMKIRIDWCAYSSDEDLEIEYLNIEASNLLFIGGRFFWGIIDMHNNEIARIEECLQFWYFKEFPESILIVKELEAEAISYEGRTIDIKPIDPPWENKEYDGYIEFESPISGRQLLRLK